MDEHALSTRVDEPRSEQHAADEPRLSSVRLPWCTHLPPWVVQMQSQTLPPIIPCPGRKTSKGKDGPRVRRS